MLLAEGFILLVSLDQHFLGLHEHAHDHQVAIMGYSLGVHKSALNTGLQRNILVLEDLEEHLIRFLVGRARTRFIVAVFPLA